MRPNHLRRPRAKGGEQVWCVGFASWQRSPGVWAKQGLVAQLRESSKRCFSY
jgi:hypothetical protein